MVTVVVAIIAVVAFTYYFLVVRGGVGVDEMMLKSTDVPPEFRENVHNTLLSLDYAAVYTLKTSVDNLQKWGYKDGYIREFYADNQTKIDSGVLRFSNVSGAGKAFSWMETLAASELSEVAVTQAIGDERAGYTGTEDEAVGFMVLFREANIMAWAEVFGPVGVFSLDNVVTYAQIVESRT